FYPALLKARYRLGDDIDLNDPDLSDYDLLIASARKRGMLLRGGEADTERFADALLDDFRSCRIGRITLDRI
ncbi:MAG: ribosome biogenesis GTPase YlqF, partial [Clostridia bacterium]|nr:ribosome biogenesis GTPase YlqF [Clostridia bacterium]